MSTLNKRGAFVRTIMTESATRFVSPVTFQTLSNYPVSIGLFEDWKPGNIRHISNAEWADVVVIAPATANIIGKIANGIADDLLTTTVMAAECQVVMAPSMNDKMYANPVLQKNVQFLRELGYSFIEPESGYLACGREGRGRMAAISTIVDALENFFVPKDLQGVHILVTAGGTQEDIDPVRYISNQSSGKMGYSIASQARKRGALVTLITAPSCLPAPSGVKTIRVRSAREMLAACRAEFPEVDVLIMAAAVADYEPEEAAGEKIKKDADNLTIILRPTPDILVELGAGKKKEQMLVGFSAETQDLKENARRKMLSKKVDMIVANDVSDGIFGSDFTSIIIMSPEGSEETFDKISKVEAADVILNSVLKTRKMLGG